jgi:hypothetical protein
MEGKSNKITWLEWLLVVLMIGTAVAIRVALPHREDPYQRTAEAEACPTASCAISTAVH